MARLWGHDWTRTELLERVGRIEQIAGFRLSILENGPGRASRVLDVETGGGLAFRVLLDRGADIGACRIDGRPVAWISSVGEAHPANYRPAGEGWLRTFGGGLVTTCGLDAFGAASRDGPEEFGLHGQIGHATAEEVSYHGAWVGDDYELEIQATVRQTRVFGENLTLRRSIRTTLGSNRIEVTDDVTNAGFRDEPHMLLYHCNLGFPLLDDSATITVDADAPTPRDAAAEAGLLAWHRGEIPRAQFAEQVFLHTFRPTPDGASSATVVNDRAGLRLTLSVNAGTLPYLYQWKMMGRGTYVMGLEPANCRGIAGRAHAREVGELPTLEPQETRRYQLSFEVSHAAPHADGR